MGALQWNGLLGTSFFHKSLPEAVNIIFSGTQKEARYEDPFINASKVSLSKKNNLLKISMYIIKYLHKYN